MEILATHELAAPSNCNINQYLRQLFPARSIESIKGQRNKNAHYAALAAENSISHDDAPDSDRDSDNDWQDVFRESIMIGTEHQPKLSNILMRGFNSDVEEELNLYITSNFIREPKSARAQHNNNINDRRPYRRRVRLLKFIRYQQLFKRNK